LESIGEAGEPDRGVGMLAQLKKLKSKISMMLMYFKEYHTW
jgi:hypothetical protein